MAEPDATNLTGELYFQAALGPSRSFLPENKLARQGALHQFCISLSFLAFFLLVFTHLFPRIGGMLLPLTFWIHRIYQFALQEK